MADTIVDEPNEPGIAPFADHFFNDRPTFSKWLKRLNIVFPRIRMASVTLDPASVAANTTAEQTFALTGLSTQDIVVVNKPSHSTGLGIVGCRVSAADTLAITYGNFSGAPIDPPSEDYFVVAIRR